MHSVRKHQSVDALASVCNELAAVQNCIAECVEHADVLGVLALKLGDLLDDSGLTEDLLRCSRILGLPRVESVKLERGLIADESTAVANDLEAVRAGAVACRGDECTRCAVGVFAPAAYVVLNLDIVPLAVLHLCVDLHGQTADPLPEVELMRALVEKNASALSAPGCAPVARVIVILRAVPIGDEPACSSDLTELARCDDVVHLAVNGVGALIEHHTENELGMLISLRDHLAYLKGINARGLFTHNVNAVLERLDGEIRMGIVRNSNEDSLAKARCDQVIALGENCGSVASIALLLCIRILFESPLAANLAAVCNGGDLNIRALAVKNVSVMLRADVADSDNT